MYGVKHIRFHEVYVGVVGSGIVAGNGEGGRRDVHGRYLCRGESVLECDGYAAATGAEVEDGGVVSLPVGEPVGEAGNDFLRFGAGDEHVGGDADAQTAEVGVANDVLDGSELLKVFDGPVESQQVRLVDGVVAVQQQLGLVPP